MWLPKRGGKSLSYGTEPSRHYNEFFCTIEMALALSRPP